MILKSEIEEVVASQWQNIVSRDLGLDRQTHKDLPASQSHALIITGIRRSGKSTLMYQMIRDSKENCFFLNLDDPRLFGFELEDFQKVRAIIEENEAEQLFFDEVQLVDQWERFIRQLTDSGKYRIVVTGSNASMLSSEMGTRLTGRHVDRELFPFSFGEFLKYSGLPEGAEASHSYLDRGGFPAYLETSYPEVLSEVLNDIIYRDICIRYGVRNHQILKQLALYLLTNVGKLITASSLRKLIPVASTSTMMEYLGYFENAYLMFFLPKFSYSYRKQIQNPRKVYAIDTGMVLVNSVSFSLDEGRRFENMVFLALRRKFKEVFYYAGKGECDFVICQKGNPKTLIQVCLKLSSENLSRELGGLHEAMKEFEINHGSIVTLDQKDNFISNGLEVEVLSFHSWYKLFQ